MIINKIESEIQPLIFKKVTVLCVSQSLVSALITRMKCNQSFDIPKHLKRVKKLDNGRALVIYKMLVLEGFTTIDVPITNPFTSEEYKLCNKIWPCYYYAVKKESIDVNYVNRLFEKMIGLIKNSALLFDKHQEETPENCIGDQLEKNNTPIKCAGACLIVNTLEESVLAMEKDEDNVLNHSVLKAIINVSKQQANYLCTGLDAFILNEPCLSCSMAFVHGRISRVFYVINGTGTYSKLKIHAFKKFNHRYRVYKIDKKKIET